MRPARRGSQRRASTRPSCTRGGCDASSAPLRRKGAASRRTPPRLALALSYGHFFWPPGDVSLFWPPGHLPAAFVCGFPLPGPTVIAADATPLAANTIADARSATCFFMLSLSLACPLVPRLYPT